MTDFSAIKAFAFDIDGVMTDGGILCDLQGELYRTFDAKDSFAVRMAAMNGYPVATITGGRSESIRQRMLGCGVPPEDIFLAARDKYVDFKKFCERYGLEEGSVMFFGDDLPDIPVMQHCVGVAPSDAVAEVKEAAEYVSPFPGGKGCIRDTFEKVMKQQGRWNYDVQEYKRRF